MWRPHFFAKGVVINRSLDRRFATCTSLSVPPTEKKRKRKRGEKEKDGVRFGFIFHTFTRFHTCFFSVSNWNIEQICALSVSDIN